MDNATKFSYRQLEIKLYSNFNTVIMYTFNWCNNCGLACYADKKF